MHFTVIEKQGSFTNFELLKKAISEILEEGCYAYYRNKDLSKELTDFLEYELSILSVPVTDNEKPTKIADIILVLHTKPRCKFEIHDNILMPIEDCF
jgi:hypothetical protein